MHRPALGILPEIGCSYVCLSIAALRSIAHRFRSKVDNLVHSGPSSRRPFEAAAKRRKHELKAHYRAMEIRMSSDPRRVLQNM